MTILDFYKNSTPRHYLVLIAASVLIIVSILFEINLSDELIFTVEGQANIEHRKDSLSFLELIYIKHFYLVWLTALCLFIVGSWKSFVSSFDTPGTLTAQLIVASFIIFMFLALGLICLGRLAAGNEGLHSALITVFAVLSASVGWLISAQISRVHQQNNEEITKHNHRRSHTINIILSQRLSPEYHENVSKVKRAYSIYSQCIPRADVDAYLAPESNVEPVLSQEKLDAITASLFLLDLYEFICEGISQGDLDEDVIYESIGGVMIRCRQRSKHLITAVIQGDDNRQPLPKAFCKFLRCVDSWVTKHNAEEEEAIKKQ